MKNLEKILDEWATNNSFREAFKKDPKAALAAANIQVTLKELKELKINYCLNKIMLIST